MGLHTAVIVWERSGARFVDNQYSRGHRWQFDGGIEVPASSSPHSVPLPLSVAEAVDPEEAFVAAISSCHMLWFLFLAARRGFVVESYRDEASGNMGKNAAGKLAITEVNLRPDAKFVGEHCPTRDELLALHHDAHEQCFIANSVTATIDCNPV